MEEFVTWNSDQLEIALAFNGNNVSHGDVLIEGKHHDSFALSVIMFTLCFVGCTGNTISAIIFSRKSMRSSINTLLTGLSIIDTMVLLFAVPVFAVPSFAEAVPALRPFVYVVYPYIVLVLYPMSMAFQTSSVWIFVVINVERYLAVCHPFCVRKYFTSNRTRLTLGGVALFSFFYNFVRFWEYGYDQETGIQMLLRINKSYYYVYFTTLYLLTHFAVPFITMIILNTMMMISIAHSHRFRRQLTKRTLLQQRTTHMIIVVTIMFGVCNTLPFVINIWEAVKPALFIANLSKSVLVITDISNSLVILNSSTTFVIYLIYCKKYRRMFSIMFNIGDSRRESLINTDNNTAGLLYASEYAVRDDPVSNQGAQRYRLRTSSDRTLTVGRQHSDSRNNMRCGRTKSMVYESLAAFHNDNGDVFEGDKL